MDGIRQRAIAMTRGTLVRIENGSGVQIHVWDGELWITQEGDRRDYLVKAGQTFELGRDGAAVIHALHRTVVTMTTSVSESFAKRITLTPPGTCVPRVLYNSAEQPGRWLGGLRRWLMRAWVDAYARYSRPTPERKSTLNGKRFIAKSLAHSQRCTAALYSRYSAPNLRSR